MPRRSTIMEANHAPLQSWIASQHAQTTNRRPAAPALSSLKDFPFTALEWKRALSELKRDYSNRRYRPCSSRCIELLKNAQTRDNIQPAYLIYLHFYAATSLEMQARSLHAGSHYRLKLFEEAREHYNLASQTSEKADKQAFQIVLRPASPSSSLPSPIESCLSHQSTSTRMSSPTPSTASNKGTQIKRKKKVAFADELQYDPPVRPDSPTLGFSDPGSGRTSPCQDTPLHPVPPSVQTMPDICPAFSPTSSIDGDDVPRNLAEQELPPSEGRESLERYCTVLSSIQRQITSHLSAIDREITAALTPKAYVPANDEMRALELRSRIERLRANGWKRKRFDAHRYEEFREQVTADMVF
ncbi:hypothetical protein CCM_02342 [Cordyceps militaris CM01]|uniref:Uncharacterized protein n=1 Tax=Cordyceps militaris (strain CM01) TaxID=983644 RepID=G3J992_CORMM|nr:uncharacterized protein CCM_02342 [Cordyceps militaris CM01]EGX94071.1 hypothetical protein CCM_02342 [Cordyceps militaris CM01]